MLSLGIDPSTKTGLALVCSDKGLLWSEEVKIPKGHKGIKRALTISDAVADVLNNHDIDVICIEGYGFGNKHTLATLVEVGTLIRLVLELMTDGYYVVPPPNLKKFFTGKGNSPKDVMILEAYKRFGVETRNNNIADAVALSYFGLAKKGVFPFTLPQNHLDALTKVKFKKSDFLGM